MGLSETAKPKAMKEKLIEAAIDLFHKHGVHWVSFQQIAEKVGVSQPALYKHFKNKDDLLSACIVEVAHRNRAFIDAFTPATNSAQGKLRAHIEGSFTWLEKCPKEAATFLAMFYFAYNSGEIAVAMKEVNSQNVQRISSHIISGNYESIWNVPDPRTIARFIHNLLIGEMIKAIHHPKELKIETRVELVCALVQKLLNGARESMPLPARAFGSTN